MIKNISSFIKLKPVLAVGFLFSSSSLLFGTWVASIPGIKYRLGFTDASLGLSLLLSPLGALTGVALSTRIFSKLPVGKWMIAGYLTLCIIMILQINSVNRIMFWICLYSFGMMSFLNGVSVNTTVGFLEKKYNRRMMSTCHGMYSLGGGVSAALATIFFALHLQSGLQIILVALFICTVVFFNRRHLLSNSQIIHSGSGIKLPSLSILSISFICMVIFMSEGCVADWSAIYLRESLHGSKEIMGLGYAGFSAAMTIGRLNGDDIITKFGSKNVVITGALLAATGFSIVVLAPIVSVAIAGYILIGFGCCCIVPVLFSASATIPGVSAVEGFAMVTTGGLIGFLTGPSLIGFISEKVNLSTGLSLLILLMLTAAVVAWKNRFLANKKSLTTEVQYDEQIY
ncbi:MAG TPA: MFS transporter [Chitinophagaceae bacterium]|jgi:MFS family permease|nr:MFS transporter [Chitinophagaceae bacterium]